MWVVNRPLQIRACIMLNLAGVELHVLPNMTATIHMYNDGFCCPPKWYRTIYKNRIHDGRREPGGIEGSWLPTSSGEVPRPPRSSSMGFTRYLLFVVSTEYFFWGGVWFILYCIAANKVWLDVLSLIVNTTCILPETCALSLVCPISSTILFNKRQFLPISWCVWTSTPGPWGERRRRRHLITTNHSAGITTRSSPRVDAANRCPYYALAMGLYFHKNVSKKVGEREMFLRNEKTLLRIIGCEEDHD